MTLGNTPKGSIRPRNASLRTIRSISLANAAVVASRIPAGPNTTHHAVVSNH